jgi:pilus assembly protein CpaC
MAAYVQKVHPTRRLIAALLLLVAVVGRSTLYAQVPAPQPMTVAAALESATPVEPTIDAVRLLVGRSTIVDVGKPIARVSLTSADVADALVTSPSELLVNGKAPGVISMFVWDRAGAIRRYEVVVQRDLARLSTQIKELFPKESIEVRANGRSAVLAGTVSSSDVAEKMTSLAAAFVENKDELVSLLQVGPAGRSNQVLLRVRFAEVSRSAMTDLGVSLFTGPAGHRNYLARSATDQIPAPDFDVSGGDPKLVFSDYLNLFLFNTKEQLGGVIKALQTRGLFQSLAEPNLIAESGKEASFLAGGEFPIPVAQASSGGTSISIQFKEFGIRLNFTPTVNGDRVHLKVRPEVSALDFTNAITLQGFRIPALTTRRTETEVELNNGQTFAIAGLMNNQMNETIQKIPGLGDIPILGYLFRSKAAQKNQTELVVMITPEILQNDSPGVTPNLPRQAQPYLPPLTNQQSMPAPPPPFQASAPPATVPVADASKPSVATVDATSSPAAAAATLNATSAATRNVVQSPTAAPAAPVADQANQTAEPAAEAAPPVDPREAERARRAERERQQAEARAQAEEARRQARMAEEDRRKARVEAERQARVAREQAARDAEEAKRAEEAAKKQAEADRKRQQAEAEAEKKRQQAEAEAERRLKEAQAAYEAELSRIQGK